MLQLSREERKLDYDGLTNTRDLGGYETRNGYYTKARKFVRSSNLLNLSKVTIGQLLNYGINQVIDLRSDYEKKHQPSALKGIKGIKYEEVDILNISDFSVLPDNIRDYQTLGGFYIYMIESSKEAFKRIFELLAANLDGVSLFNCSAGKDRTGVVSALLLDLVGCYDYDIVKDYSESYANNLIMMKKLEEVIEPSDLEYLGSSPKNMMIFLDYLIDNYGSAREYLLSCGIEETLLQDIIDTFTI